MGDVTTADRIHLMFSQSKRRAASRNFPISKFSIPNAFTTRLPLTVSSRICDSSPTPSWIFRRATDAFPDVLTRQNHDREEDNRAERHLPIGREQDGQQKKKCENMPKSERQVF